MSKLIKDPYNNGYCIKCRRCLSGSLCPFKAGTRAGLCLNVKECDSFEPRDGNRPEENEVDQVSS